MGNKFILGETFTSADILATRTGTQWGDGFRVFTVLEVLACRVWTYGGGAGWQSGLMKGRGF